MRNARPDLAKLEEPHPKAQKQSIFGSSLFKRFDVKQRSVVREYFSKSFTDAELKESDQDPLSYWRKKNVDRALRLVFYALLSLDCSNAGAEGTFSELRNLVTDKRSNFTSQNVNRQLTNKSMLKQFKRIESLGL